MRGQTGGVRARAQAGLSPENVVARAQALSCAGCPQLSPKQDMGGNLGNWPDSLVFTHTTEQQTEQGPDGERFAISPALSGTFIPHRVDVIRGSFKF